MFRLATKNDVNKIMDIVKVIIVDMKCEGNYQWDEFYPTDKDFLNDINNNNLYVLEENDTLLGFICVVKANNKDYENVSIKSRDESYIIHRLGVNKNYRNQKIAQRLLEYGEKIAKKNNIFLMKSDTKITNIKMNNLFQKVGYIKKCEFQMQEKDGNYGTYNYYEKDLRM